MILHSDIMDQSLSEHRVDTILPLVDVIKEAQSDAERSKESSIEEEGEVR